MKARITLGDVIVSLPIEFLDQQTCCDSVFNNVPACMVDLVALIEANRENREIKWYRQGANNDMLHITVPTDLIVWAE